VDGLWSAGSETAREFRCKSFPALLKVRLDGLNAEAPLDIWRLDLAQTIKVLADVYLVESNLIEELMNTFFLRVQLVPNFDSVE
jgi:hypothetical protein